jgi:hypothetical protein
MFKDIPHIPIGGRLVVETRGNQTIYTMKSNDELLDVSQSKGSFLLYFGLLLFFLWLGGCFDGKNPTPSNNRPAKTERVAAN